MITIQKINLFNSYGGDVDGLTRVGHNADKNLFADNDDWSVLENLYHDIELINKNLASHTYIEQTILKLKQHCDPDSFTILTGKIECFNDFHKVAAILYRIRGLISQKTDTVLAGFDNTGKFLEELDHTIQSIELCDYQVLEKVNMAFSPTSTYQELSLSNGWSNTYIKLSAEFDKIYARLTKSKPPQQQ